MLMKMFLALTTSSFTGITLRTPRSAWFTVGLAGMSGWAVRDLIARQNIPELVAAVSGAIAVGLTAEIFARIQKQPVTVYIVSGIIPLVPGITAYNSMVQFLEKNFELGFFLAFKAFLIASYLAAGLAMVPLFVRAFKNLLKRSRIIKRN